MGSLTKSELKSGSPGYPPYVYAASVDFGAGESYATGGVNLPSGFPFEQLSALSVVHLSVASPGVAVGATTVLPYWQIDFANKKLKAYKDASFETELDNATDLSGHQARVMLIGW